MPLMQALQARHSTREFASQALPPQTLSERCGGRRRQPAGIREADRALGARLARDRGLRGHGPRVHLYLPQSHALRRVLDRDVRASTGRQDFPARRR